LISTIIGTGAIIFSLIQFAPQVWKSWTTKSTGDISWGMLILGIIASIFWVVWGLLQMDPVIIITDSFYILMLAILLYIKIKSWCGQ